MSRERDNEHEPEREIEDELKDRLVDCLLAEVEGRGPAPDLERSTLDALADAEHAPAPPTARRHSWAAAAVAVLALSVVAMIAWWQGGGEGARESPARVQDPPPRQDPAPRDARQLVAALADPDETAAAERDLLALGAAAVPALIAGLEDERAPRRRILEVLDAMERVGAPALQAIAELMPEVPKTGDVIGPAFRAAATLIPFADEDARTAAERAMLVVAFLDDGPAAGGAGVAVGGKRAHTYSMREVARLLHRQEVDVRAPTRDLIAALQGDSPYGRELAARLLGDHGGEAVIAALREAIAVSHPTKVRVAWGFEGFSGTFSFTQNHDAAIRAAAARALVRLSATTPAGTPAHAWLLEHGNQAEQRAAAAAIARGGVLEEDRAAAAAAVTAALEHADPIVLRESIVAAGILGVQDDGVRARLEQLAGHADEQVAARAKAALRALDR